MRLFGSSGIRGVVNEKITPKLCKDIGRAVGDVYKDVIMGHDPRPTADLVTSALIAGLTSSGADVHRAGMLTTSTLAHAAEDHDCGVMVTASHNPKEYNGIKLWNPDGSSFNTAQMEEIEEKLQNTPSLASWDQVGNVYRTTGAIEDHIEDILDRIGKDFQQKVVVDCANGSASTITPYLLKKMGCEVITLNAQPDGTFPAHPSEPVEKNLQRLKKAVKTSGADLGIAHDGDGDRMVAFDPEGNYLGGDELLKLFAMEVEGTVVVPVNSSMAIDELAEEVYRTKVGDVFVSERLKQESAAFGGEPSGTWIFPELSYGPDGIFAAAKLVEMNSEMSLTETVEDLPKYPRKKTSIITDNKREVMEKLISLYEENYSDERFDLVDGIRSKDDDGWSLIRASGTEPKIRITAEARDRNALERVFKKAKDDLEACMEEIR